jgi:hypothetical protein
MQSFLDWVPLESIFGIVSNREIEALHFLSRMPAKMNVESRFLAISRHFCTFSEAGASEKCKPISRHFQVK